MKSTKKTCSMLLATALLLTTLSPLSAFGEDGAANPSQPTSTAVEAIHDTTVRTPESTINALINQYNTTSLQYALIDQGQITKSGHGGVYSKSENKALTEETLYGIGSISKLFTTTAVMKLVDLGKIQLDAPVTTYIPEFKMADERYQDITVRMLLNHSSGFMGSTMNNAFLFNDPDQGVTENLLVNLQEQRLKATPGAFSVYCNDGFTLAELVVERVSGQSFTTFLHETITTPLNLKNTKTPEDDFQREQLAKTYSGLSKDALPVETVNVIGTGGLYSTATDMCKFAQIFMDQKGQASSVLSKNAVASMASPDYLKGTWPAEEPGKEGSLSYGLGWDNVRGEALLDYQVKELVKGGDTLSYHSSMVVLPEENMAAVVLSSGGASPYDQLLAEALLLQALEGKGKLTADTKEVNLAELAAKPTPTAVEIPKSTLENQGYYAGMGSLINVAMTTPGTLSITIPDMPDYMEKYTHTGNGIFKDRTGLVDLSFVGESNGHTYLHLVGPTIYPGLGTVNSNVYQAQKITENPLTPSVQKAWADRMGKNYFVLNEKFSSELYSTLCPVGKVTPLVGGYMGSNKIIHENLAQSVLQIPGTIGRDLSDFSFYKKDGHEYLKFQSNLSISEDAIGKIYQGTTSVCTIGKEGYAKWYKIGAAAGKTMTVTLPQNASFAIYNQAFACVQASTVKGGTSAPLPANGYIVFAGNEGSQFKIQLH